MFPTRKQSGSSSGPCCESRLLSSPLYKTHYSVSGSGSNLGIRMRKKLNISLHIGPFSIIVWFLWWNVVKSLFTCHGNWQGCADFPPTILFPVFGEQSLDIPQPFKKSFSRIYHKRRFSPKKSVQYTHHDFFCENDHNSESFCKQKLHTTYLFSSNFKGIFSRKKFVRLNNGLDQN
jgi:hypothetical protein